MIYLISQHRKAKKLYIIEGKKTLDEIARLTGISCRTISNWSVKEGWKASRLEYHQRLENVELNLLKLYEAMTKKASESLDPQDIEQVIYLGKRLEKKGGVL